jgi:hypothetical protein
MFILILIIFFQEIDLEETKFGEIELYYSIPQNSELKLVAQDKDGNEISSEKYVLKCCFSKSLILNFEKILKIELT